MTVSAAAHAEQLARELSGLVGSEVWSTEPGIGSHLGIDLGDRMEQRVEIRGRQYVHVVGEWHLWIQLAAWRVEGAAEVLLGSEDDRPFIAEKIGVLHGRRVTSVEVKPPGLETVLCFGDVRLLLFPVDSALSAKPGESAPTQWSLWRPQGDIVSVDPGPDGPWTVEPSKARTVRLGAPDEPASS